MFIVAKSFTNKRGEMFLKIFPNQYPSIETAHAAMQTDYQEELKKRHLDRSDEETAFRRFVRVPLAKGEHYVEALYEQDFGSFPLAMGARIHGVHR